MKQPPSISRDKEISNEPHEWHLVFDHQNDVSDLKHLGYFHFLEIYQPNWVRFG
jgi:hypothetical protein